MSSKEAATLKDGKRDEERECFGWRDEKRKTKKSSEKRQLTAFLSLETSSRQEADRPVQKRSLPPRLSSQCYQPQIIPYWGLRAARLLFCCLADRSGRTGVRSSGSLVCRPSARALNRRRRRGWSARQNLSKCPKGPGASLGREDVSGVSLWECFTATKIMEMCEMLCSIDAICAFCGMLECGVAGMWLKQNARHGLTACDIRG